MRFLAANRRTGAAALAGGVALFASVAASALSYSGSVSVASGDYLATEQTQSLYFYNGVGLATGRWRLSAGLALVAVLGFCSVSEAITFDVAADFTARIVEEIEDVPLPAGTLLNINVPAGEPEGVEVTRLGKRIYRDELTLEEEHEGRSRYRIYGEVGYHHEPGTDLAAVEPADLVIEAATEHEPLKARIFGDIDRHSAPGAILATNTSSISITSIAARTELLLGAAIVLAAAYAVALVHRWAGAALLLALLVRFDADPTRAWNRVRFLFGVVWLAIVASVFAGGRTQGLLEYSW